MKKNISYKLICAIAMSFILFACNDKWDEHYNTLNITNKSSLNLYQYMKTQEELSSFCNMLHIAGYDSILSHSITYTVWAPQNEALANVNMLDTANVKKLVQNHVSRFAYPTAGLNSKVIYMLDKKFVTFKQKDNGYSFGDKDLIAEKSNVATANGILHQVNGYVPYLYNIWEYIGATSGLDSLRSYLYSQNSYEFDEKNSVEIGTNEFGQAIYDSVIVFSNPILERIGSVYAEDSVFTAILPTNNAWTKAYNKTKPGYNVFGDITKSLQRKYTQASIVDNLIFKQAVAEPSTTTDLTSTTGTQFTPASYLFDGANKHELSNGYAYTTDSLRFKAADSYQKTIKIEAENSSYGRSSTSTSLNVLNSQGSSLSGSISNNQYLVVPPTGVNDNMPDSVTFPIPNTLSGKYRIYCVFVPSSISDASSIKNNKVKFFLTYQTVKNSAAFIQKDATINSLNKVVTTAGATPGTFTTTVGQLTKMFVTEFTFPYCNIYDSGSSVGSITTKLKVVNASKIADEVVGKSDRTMRIDCIILEPVP